MHQPEGILCVSVTHSNNPAAAEGNGSDSAAANGEPSIEDIKRNIARYNEHQTIVNEDIFGPLQNDSVIVVVQVSDDDGGNSLFV